jgi:hypothetical protein
MKRRCKGQGQWLLAKYIESFLFRVGLQPFKFNTFCLSLTSLKKVNPWSFQVISWSQVVVIVLATSSPTITICKYLNAAILVQNSKGKQKKKVKALTAKRGQGVSERNKQLPCKRARLGLSCRRLLCKCEMSAIYPPIISPLKPQNSSLYYLKHWTPFCNNGASRFVAFILPIMYTYHTCYLSF